MLICRTLGSKALAKILVTASRRYAESRGSHARPLPPRRAHARPAARSEERRRPRDGTRHVRAS